MHGSSDTPRLSCRTSSIKFCRAGDTANKAAELADYSACTTWGIKGKRICLLHVFRKRLNYPDLKRAVREQAEMHKATDALIEDRASGTQLCQDLVSEGFRIVRR
jgi:phage terminase large subunit-like protein